MVFYARANRGSWTLTRADGVFAGNYMTTGLFVRALLRRKFDAKTITILYI